MNARMTKLGAAVGAAVLAAVSSRMVAGGAEGRGDARSPGAAKLAAAAGAPAASGRLVAGPVVYKDGDQELHGYLAFEPSRQGKRPAILIAPE